LKDRINYEKTAKLCSMEKIENSIALFDGIKYEKINEALFNNDMTAFIYLFFLNYFRLSFI